MALATDLVQGTIQLTADLHGSGDAYSPELTATGVVPGEYTVPSVVVDQKGRILYIQNHQIDLPCADVGICGGVKIPSSGHINNAAGDISLPYASTTDYGVVKLASGFKLTGTDLDLDYPKATATTLGLITTGTGLYVDGTGNLKASLATESTIGIVQIGTGLDVAAGVVTADLSELSFDQYATEVSPGIMMVGNGLDVTNGVVSVNLAEVQYQDATEFSKGIMQVGNGLDVTNGVVSVNLSEVTYDNATEFSKGIMQAGNGLAVNAGVVSVDLSEVGYQTTTSQYATEVSKGIMQVGAGLVVTSGVVSVDPTGISLPDATYSSKGIVQIDGSSALTINVDYLGIGTATDVVKGVVTVDTSTLTLTSGSVGLPAATAVTLGGVLVGSNIGVDVDGTIYRGNTASYSTKGILSVTADTGLDITAGALSGITATPVTKGLVSVGTNINVTSGTISVNTSSSTSILGVAKSSNSTHIDITGGAVDFGSNIALADKVGNWQAQQYTPMLLLGTGSVTPDFSLSNVFGIVLDQNTTINAPINAVDGGCYTILVEQDLVGGHTITFDPAYKFNQTPTATPGASSVDVFSCVRRSSTSYISQYLTNFS